MSLQEEITEILDVYEIEGIDPGEDIEKIINKVLDAAVEAVKTTKGIVTADDALYVINKLLRA